MNDRPQPPRGQHRQPPTDPANNPASGPGDGPGDDPVDDESAAGASSFAWEFGGDDRAGSGRNVHPLDARQDSLPPSPRYDPQPWPPIGGSRPAPPAHAPQAHEAQEGGYTAANRGERSVGGEAGHFAPQMSVQRASYVRAMLDQALDRWWAVGELPPRWLLREGLILLENGLPLEEAMRTLLLRMALAYQRGMITALRHQHDWERVALLCAEALVEWEPPLDVAQLVVLRQASPQRERWEMPLVRELQQMELTTGGVRRRHAQAALMALGALPVTPVREPRASSRRHWPQRRTRQVLLLALILAFIGFFVWQRLQLVPGDMVQIPAGTYLLPRVDAAGAVVLEPVALASFWLDRFEVTNAEYRQCAERGRCQWPVSNASATHPTYFVERAFDDYPVVNLSHATASAYCASQGKRLPTADEWMTAAGAIPGQPALLTYPWGERFDQQRANNATLGLGDTSLVGNYRPAGDAPSGATDMAGNVAEWTDTVWTDNVGNAQQLITKGGSFQNAGAELAIAATILVAPDFYAPWLGFRCVRGG